LKEILTFIDGFAKFVVEKFLYIFLFSQLRQGAKILAGGGPAPVGPPSYGAVLDPETRRLRV